ncbi:MAG: hypothetical protein GTO55_11000 [Armatimonadetes bacterium]|nr:hypothetical protein [Armatimonadota bacterium]NIN06838.1 hypothetical protein [Armatimonadota bacterium]NIT32135.1 hypothetical protein [Armatimonadota bacterium]
MTRAEDAIEVLDALSEGDVSVWLFGGWAVEAQISAARRPHRDVDLVVNADDLERAQELVERIGYTEQPDPDDPCEHLRFGRRRGDTLVQVSALRCGRTQLWLSVTARPGARDSWLRCPPDGFPSEAQGCLCKRPVRCATPEVLLQSKLSWHSSRQVDLLDEDHLRSALSQEQVERAEQNSNPLSRSCCDADCEAVAGDLPR